MNDRNPKEDTFAPNDSQAWRELLHAALLELDEKKLAAKIDLARKTVLRRIEHLEGGGSDVAMERLALKDALNSLRALENILSRR